MVCHPNAVIISQIAASSEAATLSRRRGICGSYRSLMARTNGSKHILETYVYIKTMQSKSSRDPIDGNSNSHFAVQASRDVTPHSATSSPIDSYFTGNAGLRDATTVGFAGLDTNSESAESSGGWPRLAAPIGNFAPHSHTTRHHVDRKARSVVDFDRLCDIQETILSSGNGPSRLPTRDDFPRSMSLAVVPRMTEKPVEHVVILLHEFGGTEETLEAFALRLRERQPETAFILLRGVESVPTGNSGHNWSDPGNDWNEGFSGAGRKILIDVIKTGLITNCGFEPRNIMLLGHGQGGMAALATVAACHTLELGGVVTIGGPMPAYAQLPHNIKARTPALVLRRELGDINAAALQQLRDNFVCLDVSTQPGVHVTIPERQEEIEPVLDFFAHRLGREEWTKQAILSFGTKLDCLHLITMLTFS